MVAKTPVVARCSISQLVPSLTHLSLPMSTTASSSRCVVFPVYSIARPYLAIVECRRKQKAIGFYSIEIQKEVKPLRCPVQGLKPKFPDAKPRGLSLCLALLGMAGL